jgi:hypothetical protein
LALALYAQRLVYVENGLPVANTTAYFASLAVRNKKVFKTLTSGVIIIKPFYFVTDNEVI